jgi:thiol:disulfide interchange protein DsbD
MKILKKFALFLPFLFALPLLGQIYDPVSWKTEVLYDDKGHIELLVHADIEKGWHLYSQYLEADDGPIATEFTFPESKQYQLQGKVLEPKARTEYDPNFDMELAWFDKQVTFTQKIIRQTNNAFTVKAEVYYMVCDAEKCLPPEYVDLIFEIKAEEKQGTEDAEDLMEDKAEELEERKEAKEEKEEETPNQIGQSTDGELQPVKWNYHSVSKGDNKFELHFAASIEAGWHLYGQELESDEGPLPTAFYFNDKYHLLGKTRESENLHTTYDKVFEMELSYFEDSVRFVQLIKTTENIITAEFEYMVCNDRMCLPPELIEVQFNLQTGEARNALELSSADSNTDLAEVIPVLPKVDLENPLGQCGENKNVSNIWMVFLFGFLGGLIALLTPCVFPMIPLTVSFFTKGGGNPANGKAHGKGVGKAVLYGFFIFLIYAVLSIPFHFNTDPEVLNEIATSVWLNIIFFVVFLIFAISFFGFFEITLPSSLTNKADSASQMGGVIGIFFMALTLALVSFSCTGPILGTVLGNALKNGPWPITAAMCGFGLALGLPFAIFAMFPGIMSNLPSSGGWLNSVKVVLGFIELALAVKFLSNADLVEQWGLIERETFFLIWTIIGIGLFLYLIKVIRFPHDTRSRSFSYFRIFFAAVVFLFTIYISAGIMKNPPWQHHLLSGFPPPTFYSWYDKETFHAEYTDFDEAMEEARETNKPVLVDFTGWACVNCRKMEESVWTVERIKEKLGNDFILVSLYVDDKVELPEEQQGVFEYKSGNGTKKKKIKTIGNKWATFQTQVFNNNSQPYYVMLSPDGYLLSNPVGYTPDVEKYEYFLDCGLEAYREKAKLISQN